MLQALHLLLTYRCTHACEHCFVYGSPRARGTFTRAHLREALDQASEVGTIEWIYFEGGEPFLHYPLLLEGVEAARTRGFAVGVVTNAYWATTPEDAAVWLRPLADLGLADLTVSEDAFHGDEGEHAGPAAAHEAASRLGIPVAAISVPHPSESEGVRYRGRAAECLVDGLPRHEPTAFDRCPHEELVAPRRVHLDAHGLVHLCQGVVLEGSIWETPLAELLTTYDPLTHPVVGPLVRGGPAALAAEHGMTGDEARSVSACHLCFTVRRRLRDRYPAHLAPEQMYQEPEFPSRP